MTSLQKALKELRSACKSHVCELATRKLAILGQNRPNHGFPIRHVPAESGWITGNRVVGEPGGISAYDQYGRPTYVAIDELRIADNRIVPRQKGDSHHSPSYRILAPFG
jgi:hypothetical protein